MLFNNGNWSVNDFELFSVENWSWSANWWQLYLSSSRSCSLCIPPLGKQIVKMIRERKCKVCTSSGNTLKAMHASQRIICSRWKSCFLSSMRLLLVYSISTKLGFFTVLETLIYVKGFSKACAFKHCVFTICFGSFWICFTNIFSKNLYDIG